MGFLRPRSYNFANIAISNMDICKLLHEYLLTSEVILTIHNSKKNTPVYLQNLSVSLNLIKKDSQKILIGKMLSSKESQIHAALENNSRDSREVFGLKLSRKDIQEIEKDRNGGDLIFEFNLNGTIVEDNDFFPAFETIQFSVDQSKWIKLLERVEYSKIITIEIPTTGVDSNPNYQLCYDRLLEAQGAFFRADWRQAVALCRDSIEAMPCYAESDKDIKPSSNNNYEERIRMIRQKMLHLTHLAKHSKDDISKSIKWTRDDAIYAISITGSVVNQMSKADFKI